MKPFMKRPLLSVIFFFIFRISIAQPNDVIMWYDCDHGALINSRPDHGWMSLNPGYPADPQQGGILLNNFYYLKRASDGAILCSARPPLSDKFVWNNWAVTVSAETEVYFEIVDSNSTVSGFAWLAANMLIIGSDTLDFRTGTYANWEVVSGNAFGTLPNSVIHGSMSGQKGNYWADSYSGAGEAGTGTLRSKKFTLKSGTTRVKFLKAGWDGPGGTGPWRTTTSLLGTYESQDSAVIKQHAYWIKALGCDVLACDLTNSASPAQAGLGDDMKRFVTGVNKAFELQLQYLPKISEFDAPEVYPVIRLSGTNYSDLTLMLNDMYTLYQKYPDKWYKFDDNSADNTKPFITIFADGNLLDTWTISGIPAGAKDDRFNIRYSNGYLLEHSNITSRDNNDIYRIPGNLPYWLFVENSQEVSSPGYYKPVYKETTDGSGVEQMTTWASICINGSDWDGLRDIKDNKIPIVRYTDPVYNLKPQVLVVNRFNYPLAWLTQPQEGVSRNKSTHIEPNVDWGFLEFNDVANELYNVRAYPKEAPPAAWVDTIDIQNNILKIKLDGFPLEYRLSNEPDLDTCSWSFLNVGQGGIKLNPDIDPEKSIYIQTRNSFGVGPVGKIDHNITTGLGNRDLDFPGNELMLQNNPNPFDSETQISYNLSKSGHIKISVYNLTGQKVAALTDEMQMPGYHAIHFNGSGLESGAYFYRFQSGNYSITKKMILKK
jgi:hypothetical protein